MWYIRDFPSVNNVALYSDMSRCQWSRTLHPLYNHLPSTALLAWGSYLWGQACTTRSPRTFALLRYLLKMWNPLIFGLFFVSSPRCDSKKKGIKALIWPWEIDFCCEGWGGAEIRVMIVRELRWRREGSLPSENEVVDRRSHSDYEAASCWKPLFLHDVPLLLHYT